MNASKYDHVVEVKKHAKVPWYKRCLDFSLEEDRDFMQGMYDRQKNFYLCEKGSKIYLVDSDNHENEITWMDLTNFIEVEVDDSVYRKYRYLK